MTPKPEAELRLRKWSESRGCVTIELTRRPDDADMVRLNRAVHAFVRDLAAEPASVPGDALEHLKSCLYYATKRGNETVNVGAKALRALLAAVPVVGPQPNQPK